MKQSLLLSILLLTSFCFYGQQVIVIDPGHGYTASGGNPDGRSHTEIETSLEAGLRLRNLINNSCGNWTVHMTRSTMNGWVSLSQRYSMSNSWGADYYLSIHCNAGGGTGTETFWCSKNDGNPTPDINFAKKIQANMVSYGQWMDRRCVEDASYIFHLAVLSGSSATGCLSEIGFADNNSDKAKLNSSSWRDVFANSYFQTFQSILGSCATASCGTPSGLSATSITSGSATLNWNSVSGATLYNIQYRKSGATTWSTATSSTNSKALTGLLASTAYEFKVQAVCSGNTGNYSSVATFTTSAATALNNDNCSGAQPLSSGLSCVTASGDIATATASGLGKASCDAFSGTPQLKDVWCSFVATGPAHTITLTPSSGLDGVLALYSSCTGAQVGCSDNGGGGGGIEKIITTNLTAGTTYYVRIYNYGSNSPSSTTFDLCITHPAPPSCGTPSNLSAGSITPGSATLSWTAVPGATSYTVQYRKVNTSAWTTATSSVNSKSITGLTSATSYEFQVQAVCSGTSGSFSYSGSFTTPSTTATTATVTVGTGASLYSAHPYGTVYMDERVQYIITKAELVASGWNAVVPYIKSLAFNVSSASSQAMNNFTITLGHTAAGSFATTNFSNGTNSTVVYSGTTTATSGWNTYNFSVPFSYNGNDNLLITICWNNSNFTSNSSVYSTSYSDYVSLYYRADLSGSGVCSQAAGTRSYYRPNTKMTFYSNSNAVEENTPAYRIADTENAPENHSLLEKETAASPPWEIFPNPNDGNTVYARISNLSHIQNITVTVFDLFGKQVYSGNLSVENSGFSLSFQEGLLVPGVYMITAETKEDGTFNSNKLRLVKKLVVR